MTCANENCNNRAIDSMDAVLVNADGDFACNAHCAEAYRKQVDRFFNEICHSPVKTEAYLLGG